MADAVVGFLLDNLTRILAHEVNLLLGIENEVQSLGDEINHLHLYLRRFDSRYRLDEVFNDYLNQIVHLIHEAENVIDTHIARVVQQRRSKWLRLKAYIKIPTRRETAGQLGNIRSRLQEKYQRREDFADPTAQDRELMAEEQVNNPQRRRDPFEEVDMVGFDDEVDTVMQQLTGRRARLEAITILGMSGQGKTTLASKVYNDPVVASRFPYRAWVCISQRYSRRALLETIIKCTMNLPPEAVKAMDNNALNYQIQSYLSSCRFLIVLDDVWQPEVWSDVSNLFTGNLHGSRIILTTQLSDVASSIRKNTLLRLIFLNPEESWNLLSKRVFHERECPQQLEEHGREIALKCRGLPLAILVIAGVLKRREETTVWWSRVSANVSSFINDPRERCSEILELSYKHLPFHLRQCFLSFGLFPEDHQIPARLLIYLWLVEEFVQKTERRTYEEVAEEYLDELIARNLVHVAKRSDGTVKSCRVHDLLRVFCISKANTKNYLEVRGYVEDSSTPCSSRRLAIHSRAMRYINSFRSSSNVRSLLLFGLDNERVEAEQFKYLSKGYLLLKILDMGGVAVDDIPTKIEKLICLRYLRLKSDIAKTFPKSICNLWNLQTLEIVGPLINRPTIDVWNMRQLRHFYFNGDAVIPQPPKKMIKNRLDCHNELHTLSSISLDSCTEAILAKLPNLVELGIFGDLQELNDGVFQILSRLERLEKLKLTRDLKYQNLTGLPSVELLLNIKKLSLSHTELAEDPMRQLHRLQKLQVLKLKHNAYAGNVLDCTGGVFPRLEVLKLIGLCITEGLLQIDRCQV